MKKAIIFLGINNAGPSFEIVLVVIFCGFVFISCVPIVYLGYSIFKWIRQKGKR